MRGQALIRLIREYLVELIAIREPGKVGTWSPGEDERLRYVHLLENILERLEEFDRYQSDLAGENKFEDKVPAEDVSYMVDEVRSRHCDLVLALRKLDSTAADRFNIWKSQKPVDFGRGQLRETFEHSLGQMMVFLEEEPGYRRWYVPKMAVDLIDRELMEFEPDAWAQRLRHIKAISVDENRSLPENIKRLLLELNRAYVFGNFLSVFPVARAILEHAVVDLSKRAGIALMRCDEENEREERKGLLTLVNELTESMGPKRTTSKWHKLRKLGNDILHGPNPDAIDFEMQKASNDRLFRVREHKAREVIEEIVDVLSEFYSQS